jgi:hypothetical protein
MEANNKEYEEGEKYLVLSCTPRLTHTNSFRRAILADRRMLLVTNEAGVLTWNSTSMPVIEA